MNKGIEIAMKWLGEDIESKEEKEEAKAEAKASEGDVVDFLKSNPNPEDHALHQWAESKGFNVHQVEEEIYKIATRFVSNKNLNESEQEDNNKLEDLAGGVQRAFNLMKIYTTAQESASGNKFTLTKMPTTEQIFKKLAKSDGYSEDAINFYLERF